MLFLEMDKKRLCFNLLTVSFCLLAVIAANQKGIAQGICIPKNLTINTIAGRVIYLSSIGEETVSNAVIELFEDRYKGRLVQKTTSDTDGNFSFQKLRPGKYLLIAYKSPYLLKYAVRIHLIKKPKLTDNSNLTIIKISLGTSVLKPCGGGNVVLVQDQSTKGGS